MTSHICRTVPGGSEIYVKVVPGASRDRIVGAHGDALKVQVTAPPEKGKANGAVIKLLAKSLGCPERDISIVRGGSSARKTVYLRGISMESAINALGIEDRRNKTPRE